MKYEEMGRGVILIGLARRVAFTMGRRSRRASARWSKAPVLVALVNVALWIGRKWS